MIRLLIVDDHLLMREGLKQLFESTDDLVVASQAADDEELLIALDHNNVDLVLLDVSLPGVNSFELAQTICNRPNRPPILVLSMHNDLQSARRMFKAGAMGYITKNTRPDELINAVRKVAAGGKYVGLDVSEQFFFGLKPLCSHDAHRDLTSRESSVLKLLVEGKKVTEIANQFNLSVKTISSHKINIKQKLNIENDAELIRFALNNRI